MARIRSVKPSFFMSRAVKKLTDRQKLVWIGLWPNADDEGRLLDEPGILVGQLWSLSLSEAKMDGLLQDLHNAGRIIRYEVAGERFIQVTNWVEHQRINRPTESLLPPPPRNAPSRTTHGVNTEGSLAEGKGKEGIGGGGVNAEPPLKCEKHSGLDNPPRCGACGDARRAHDAWLRAEKNKPTPAPRKGVVTPDTCNHKYLAGWCVAGCEQAEPMREVA